MIDQTEIDVRRTAHATRIERTNREAWLLEPSSPREAIHRPPARAGLDLLLRLVSKRFVGADGIRPAPRTATSRH